MDDLELFQRLGLAIAIGAAIGVERHWREREEKEGHRTAGIRTFALIGMLGGATGLLEHHLAGNGISGILLAIAFLALTLAYAAFEYRHEVDDDSYSATSVVAAMVTFSLGALAVLGDMTVASAGGVVALGILASREYLHAAMRRLKWSELRSAVILLAMTFVLLPIVPMEPIGPFGGVSPQKILVMAILLASISFCGYVAAKVVGARRGELIAGAIGGLISSTAVAISFAQRSAASQLVRPLAGGALAATAVSYLRTAFLVTALGWSVAIYLLPPLIAASLIIVAYAALLARRNDGEEPAETIGNPFELLSVIKMALLLVFVAFLARAASEYFGDRGLFAAAALSGLADIDAVTVTVTDMRGSLSPKVGALAIAIAVVSNTIAKAAYATMFGTRGFSLHVWIASALAIAAGTAVALGGFLLL